MSNINRCHPERPHFAKGFCKSCYYKHLKKENPEWANDLKNRRTEYYQTPEGKEAKRISARKCHLKTKFGISLEEYDELLEKQNGVCAICKEPNTIKGRGGKPLPLAIDHDHNTGKIRGLLCATCNIAIHKAEQDLSWFDTAKIYLLNSSIRTLNNVY